MNNRKISLRTVKPQNLDNGDKVLEFFTQYDYILTDCDGVLYVNNDVISGVPEALNKLRAMGKKICFATNNSTKTREVFLRKLRKLGYKAEMDELFPTCYSTAIYLKSIGFDKKVFVVGMDGISKELEKVGIECIGVGPDPTPSHWTAGMADIDLDPEVGAVVVGFDNQISFPKLAKACSYAKKPGCIFIASNADESFPHPDPAVAVPGPGAYVAAIEAVSGKQAICLGKPGKFFFDCIKHIHPDIDAKRTVMIGDRLTTDMVFGRTNGLKTLFVQSGLGTLEEMNNYRNGNEPSQLMCVPDLYLDSLADLNKYC
ncbi:Glycerol-3-phosphate phosphatase [Halotydeus destructor]|nr:Glycerol-3-phosphate phosphatase [Halotydeus destructor]